MSDTNDTVDTDPKNSDLLTVIDDKRFLFPGGGAKKFKQALAEFKRQRGRPPSENPKVSVTMRLDADVVAWLRDSGPGWQTRVNDALQALRRVAKPEPKE